MTETVLRQFVPPDSVADGEFILRGPDAERAYRRGARAPGQLVALDDTGWEILVTLDSASPEELRGRVTGRTLAAERRTKVSLYHALLHPADFRRLLTRATALGIVGFVPVIADGSVVQAVGANGSMAGQSEWSRLVRDAAELSGRGRRPDVGPPMLYTHAVEGAVRAGKTLMLMRGGVSLEEAASERPFTVNLFCPPPGGFSREEVERAHALGVTPVSPPETGRDPVEPALAATAALLEAIESPSS